MKDRDNRGRFTVGNGASRGKGRPKEEYKASVEAALRAKYTPSKLISMLEKAEDIAVSTNSSKGIISIVVEVRDTLMGKPVQVTETSDNNAINEAIERVREMSQETEQDEIERMFVESEAV